MRELVQHWCHSRRTLSPQKQPMELLRLVPRLVIIVQLCLRLVGMNCDKKRDTAKERRQRKVRVKEKAKAKERKERKGERGERKARAKTTAGKETVD